MSFLISPLRYEQIEEATDMKRDTPAETRAVAWKYVEWAIQNAGGTLTRQQIVAALDDKFPGLTAVQKFNDLHVAVLEYSGFMLTKPGEPVAASPSNGQ